jgi:uncharacterized protein (TIGR03435 family)
MTRDNVFFSVAVFWVATSAVMAPSLIQAQVDAQQVELASSDLKFDVASIKLIVPGSPMPTNARGREPGRYTRSHLTLAILLQIAYKTKATQIIGPSWIDSDRYDVVATMASGTTDDQVLIMLQNLLLDRFKLKLHREERIESVYALIVGKNGPKLKAAEATQLPQPTRVGPWGFSMKNAPTASLAGILMRWSDRPVIDMTGLTGRYDIELSWPPTPGDHITASNPVAALDAVEALGLKVQSRKASIEYLVVDGGQKIPTEN